MKHIRATGLGVLPESAKQPVLSFSEQVAVEKLKAQSDGGATLGELCDGLLNPDQYRDQVNPPFRIGRIKEAFGNRVASSIRPHEIKTWLSGLHQAPKSIWTGKGRTVLRAEKSKGKSLNASAKNRYKAVFSAIYEYGKETEKCYVLAAGGEKIPVNPCRAFKRFAEPKGVIRYLDPEEEARLREVLWADVSTCTEKQPIRRKWRLHRIYELDVALGAGIRKEEEYLITWDRVNFDRKEIVIPKTKFGAAREVHIIADVEHALRELQKIPLTRRQRYKDDPNAKPYPDNCVFAIRDNKKWFASALRRAKVKNFRWHDLRHTFCSRLAQKGFNLKLIHEAAGHQTITMAARYAHFNKQTLAAAMETLNRPQTASSGA